jgi:hypothetical protein
MIASFLIVPYSLFINVPAVGASYGNFPHIGNTGDQVTRTQIGIQVTAG